jgi:hypothetical protein
MVLRWHYLSNEKPSPVLTCPRSPPPLPPLIGYVALSWNHLSNENPLIARVALSWRPPSNENPPPLSPLLNTSPNALGLSQPPRGMCGWQSIGVPMHQAPACGVIWVWSAGVRV